VAFKRRNKFKREHSCDNLAIEAKQRKLSKQLNLAKTLSVTVLTFILCWMPYGFVMLLDPFAPNNMAKKVVFYLKFHLLG